VVVIPAGVAHKGEAASPDLLIVGAYPGGRGPDMQIPGKCDREHALANIVAVPSPGGDPVRGASGPLIERWRTPPSAESSRAQAPRQPDPGCLKRRRSSWPSTK
jgi:hypothetical protein